MTGLVPKLVVGPGGDGFAEKVIVPTKLLMLETVMVLLAFDPCRIETDDGLDVNPKSGPGGDCTTNIPTIKDG